MILCAGKQSAEGEDPEQREAKRKVYQKWAEASAAIIEYQREHQRDFSPPLQDRISAPPPTAVF